jgi:hypothetical protein
MIKNYNVANLASTGLIVALIAFSTQGWAAEFGAGHWSGMPYDKARVELLRKGYKPAKLKGLSSDIFCRENELCEKYPELVQCSGVSSNPCIFAFTKTHRRKQYIVVITTGETYFRVTQVRPANPSDKSFIADRQ